MTAGVRISWFDLPAAVRAGVEDILGDSVSQATPQPGGFSPGTADRVRTAGGRRAFVKAAGSVPNPRTPTLHRREAAIAAMLPAAAPTPRLLGAYDDGDWVALVFTDVAGRHPRTPWHPGELAAVAAALAELAAALTPSPLPDVPTAAEQLADDFAGWQRISRDPPAGLDPWAVAQLPRLRAAAGRGLAALAGDTLVHCDVRADNLLLRPDGSVAVVDWPWACTGPAWLDTVLLAVDVQVHGGDGDGVLSDLVARAGVDHAGCTDVLAGFVGFFLDIGRRPQVPGLPTVRAFQQSRGEALLPWLRRRISSRGT